MKHHLTQHYIYNINARNPAFLDRLISGINDGSMLPYAPALTFALMCRPSSDGMYSRINLMNYVSCRRELFPAELFLYSFDSEKPEKLVLPGRIASYHTEDHVSDFFIKAVMVIRLHTKVTMGDKWDRFFDPDCNGEVDTESKLRLINQLLKALCELAGVSKIKYVFDETVLPGKTCLNGEKKTVGCNWDMGKDKDEEESVINSVMYSFSSYLIFLARGEGKNETDTGCVRSLLAIPASRTESYRMNPGNLEDDLNDIYYALRISYNILSSIG